MYYIGWFIIIAIVILWKRDLKEAKETHQYILEIFRKEQQEIEMLKERYSLMIKESVKG